VPEEELLSLTQLTAWMAARDVVRSRAEWYRRVQAGQFGRKIGSQWVVTASEAQAMVESLALKDS
jgi:hypothetical protein